jgi:hypothetical protein
MVKKAVFDAVTPILKHLQASSLIHHLAANILISEAPA